MKYLRCAIMVIFVLMCVFLYKFNNSAIKNETNISDEVSITQEEIKNPDIASILSSFFSADLPISDLIIKIDGEDIEISGDLDKELAKKYLDEQNLLDFKTNLLFLALPDTINARLYLKTYINDEKFTISMQKIECENLSLDTNFTIYSFIF